MKKNARKAIASIITTLFLAIITFSIAIGTTLQNQPAKSGRLIPVAYAVDDQLIKQVGEKVYIKVKIENTGTVESVFLLEVKLREHGGEFWETLFLEDMVLDPSQYRIIEFEGMSCCEEMIDKHYDIKFVLIDPESDQVLDEEIVEQAWYVQKSIISASIIGYWIS
jgi:hypothetical protein